MSNTQFRNRKAAKIVSIEFAQVPNDRVIVQLACRTSRPDTTTTVTHLIHTDLIHETPIVVAIQDAISALRADHPGTTIVLDPDAELKPVFELGEWRYGWEEPLYRSKLGLNWSIAQVSARDFDYTELLVEDDRRWVFANVQPALDPSLNGHGPTTPTPTPS